MGIFVMELDKAEMFCKNRVSWPKGAYSVETSWKVKTASGLWVQGVRLLFMESEALSNRKPITTFAPADCKAGP